VTEVVPGREQVAVPAGTAAALRRLVALSSGALRRTSRDARLGPARADTGTSALLTSLRERQALLERLARIQRSISTRRPLQEVLDAIVVGAGELIGDGTSGLRLVDPEDGHALLLVASRGLTPEFAERSRRTPVGEGIGGRAISEGRLVFADDYAASDRALPGFVANGITAAMAAPVFQGEQIVGSLVVASWEQGRRYSAAEQEVLIALAEHAGLALNDARTVAALKESARQATEQARTDSLTGLPNRVQLLTALRRALGSRRPLALLFVDLDDFKVVNDTLGHPIGDALLCAVGERIAAQVRTGDLVARMGGDEFAILLVGSAEEALAGADRICAALAEPFAVPGHLVDGGASVGVVVSSPPGDDTAEELLRDADVAMYRAKAAGKRQAVLFVDSMRQDLQSRSRLEQDLRVALDQAQFVLHYQPLVHIGSRRVVGTEALVRWQHPERGLLPPIEFIGLAEETGLIVRLGRLVLLEACRQTAQWTSDEAVGPIGVSVNVSARQLADTTLLDDVADALRLSGLPAHRLTLELTESVLVSNIDVAVATLDALKRLGVRLAIDDFGTGYSSLSYLARLPVDVLKIDKVFVNRVGQDCAEGRVAGAVVALATSLGLDTVVEGVETTWQLEVLRDHGCRVFQGYLWSRPLPPEQLGPVARDIRGAAVPVPAPYSAADPRVGPAAG
jgi:diguanylate cyclase (GGDEF)-like protein